MQQVVGAARRGRRERGRSRAARPRVSGLFARECTRVGGSARVPKWTQRANARVCRHHQLLGLLAVYLFVYCFAGCGEYLVLRRAHQGLQRPRP